MANSTAEPGPRGESLFLEAEDFFVTGSGWTVANSVGQSSGKVLAGSQAGDAEATRTIHVQSGKHRLWISHSQYASQDPSRRAPFEVVILQGGAPVFTRVYDESFTGPDVATRPVGFLWQAADVTLAAGEATVVIRKIGVGQHRSTLREIDCLLLTQDLDYSPDYRDFAAQTYMRITLTTAVPGRVYFLATFEHMRRPWRDRFSAGARGARPAWRVADSELMSAGSSTGWINISRQLNPDSDSSVVVRAIDRYPDGEAQRSEFTVEFASSPENGSPTEKFSRSGPGAGIAICLPHDIGHGGKAESDLQLANRSRALAERISQQSRFGKLPATFPLLASVTAEASRNSPGVRSTEIAALRALGFNGLRGAVTENDASQGIRFGRLSTPARFVGPGGYNDPQSDRIQASIDRSAAALAELETHTRYVATSLSDEAIADKLEVMKGNPVHEAAFRSELAAKYSLKDLGLSNWDEVKLTSDRNTRFPALYLESQRFRAESIARFYQDATRRIRATFPLAVPTSQNFSDGVLYEGNFYAQGNDYFTWFRSQALDLAWSEDWSNGSTTPQLCGWNVALLRAATREHRQPIGMYVIAAHGRKALDVKLKAYSDLAQGAKALELWTLAQPYDSHEPGWYLNAPIYKAISQLTREIGAAEDVLLPAQPRPAETVIIYSRASDIWNVNHDSIDGHERSHTYLALRHQQIAVDVVDEEDLIKQGLAGRRVAYLFGEQLDTRCVRPLADWVRAGGALVLSPGAGNRDEKNSLVRTLDEGLGLNRLPLKRVRTYWGRSRDVDLIPALGTVKLSDSAGQFTGECQYIAVHQENELQPGDKILARFEDESPACVSRNVGKGHVVTYGFLPALSYAREAQREFRRTQASPPSPGAATTIDGEDFDALGAGSTVPPATAYLAFLRDLICRPAARLDSQPVTIDTPCVEATFMESPAGWAIPLANYSGIALEKMAVTIRVVPGSDPEVFSSRTGKLSVERVADNKVRVTVPLESTDILYSPANAAGSKP